MLEAKSILGNQPDLSISNKKWIIKDYMEEAYNKIRIALKSQDHYGELLECEDLMCKLLAIKEVDPQSLEKFIFPQLKNSLPDPLILKDMDKAIERVKLAIEKNEKIILFGDYDVDGGSSVALLYRFFKDIGYHNISYYIPNRLLEGYGPNKNAFKYFKDQAADLIITLDCGASSEEVFNYALELGLEVVVIDHHGMDHHLENVCAIVNPNQLDDNSGLNYLCAAGVSFLFLIALNRLLRDIGYYKKHQEPDLIKYLDLVALATVCDVVPLIELNRVFVAQGLKIINNHQPSLGFKSLKQIAGIKDEISVYHLGFLIGPRINAGGRLGDSNLGVKLLSSHEGEEANIYATSLNEANILRQATEKNVLLEAHSQIAEISGEVPYQPIVVGSHDWHEGVIGIVASRLKDKYHRPAFVLSIDHEKGLAKGSGRSISGFDMGKAVREGVEKGILLAGGGHFMAAGLSVSLDKIELFKEFMISKAQESLSIEDYLPKINIDISLGVGQISSKLIRGIKMLGPFGTGNPQPKFMLKSVMLRGARIVGEKHIKCMAFDLHGRNSIEAMAFQSIGTELGSAILQNGRGVFDVVGTINEDTWQDKVKLTFFIDDLKFA